MQFLYKVITGESVSFIERYCIFSSAPYTQCLIKSCYRLSCDKVTGVHTDYSSVLCLTEIDHTVYSVLCLGALRTISISPIATQY